MGPYNNLRVTLDTIHQKRVNGCNNKSKQLPKLKDLKQLLNKLSKIEGIKNSQLTNEQIEEKFTLKNDYVLLKKVEKLSNNTEINNYYLNVGDLLFQCMTRKRILKYKKNSIDENKIIDKKDILHFFNNNDSKGV